MTDIMLPHLNFSTCKNNCGLKEDMKELILKCMLLLSLRFHRKREASLDVTNY